MAMAGFTLINLFIIVVLISIGIYSFILFVKLAHRGIKALDIYINEKNNKL
ncbi:hypothetical protein [Clostridium kluyveri]|uniref:hypothetical protein n=1 Tax=Clostridium kluyveri TaxID=1534 RepID=UPI0003130AFF|nr:hypothetical protein [Clostridium kluyveri]UZQ50053.1 hypothetical protein OP486_19225 [Clostridium kluyveri]